MPRASLFKIRLGRPPGSIEHLREDDVAPASIDAFLYDRESLEIHRGTTLDEVERLMGMDGNRWVAIDGIRDHDLLEWLGKRLDIHPLVQEDISNMDAKPKFEDYGNFIFIISKLPHMLPSGEIVMEHCAMLLFPSMLITFTNAGHNDLEAIEERLENRDSRLRRRGPSYLAYSILDSHVDHFILAVKMLEDRIDVLDEMMAEEVGKDEMVLINQLKRSILILRREAVPFRKTVMEVKASETELIEDGIEIFIADLNDHVAYVTDSLDASREVLMDLHQLHLSVVSNRMNDIMRVLTVVATIFIPLTFIAGIYGMNFTNMPELGWEHGYFVAIIAMTAIAVSMLFVFRKRGWI